MIREKALGAWLAISGVVGLLSSFVIMVEKLHLIEDPDYVPPCDVGTVLSCSSIMKSDQSHLFGFPNPIIGLVGFPIVIFFGALLLSRVKVPEGMWAGLQVGAGLGVAFVTWLAYEAVFSIHFLCPWCMVVWSMVIPTFIYVTRRNVSVWWPESRFAGVLYGWHALIVGLWFIAIAAVIEFKFFL